MLNCIDCIPEELHIICTVTTLFSMLHRNDWKDRVVKKGTTCTYDFLICSLSLRNGSSKNSPEFSCNVIQQLQDARCVKDGFQGNGARPVLAFTLGKHSLFPGDVTPR